MKTTMTITPKTIVRVVYTGDNTCRVTVSQGPSTISLDYWAPMNGGYVREVTDTRPGTLGFQVSDDGLYHSGHMLSWSGRESLDNLIRRIVRRRIGREHMIKRLEVEIDSKYWAAQGREVL